MADRGRNCVVFIVEGDSDRIALEQPMTALFDIIDETIKVVFCKPGILGGDITSLSGVNQNNIRRYSIVFPSHATRGCR